MAGAGSPANDNIVFNLDIITCKVRWGGNSRAPLFGGGHISTDCTDGLFPLETQTGQDGQTDGGGGDGATQQNRPGGDKTKV